MTVKPEERHAQLELCIPYVFGRLNPGNRKQFEAHLASGCEQCRVELSGLYEATALLPLLLRQEAPPAGLRQRILGRLSSKKPEQRRTERTERPEGTQQQSQREKPVTPTLGRERPWYLYASIITGAILIVALIIFVNQLVGTASTQEKKIAELQGELKQLQEQAGILQGERVEMIALSGTGPGAAAYGKVLWDPAKHRAVLQTANLPMQQEGKQYQFWIQKEKKLTSIGVFDVTAEKLNTLSTMPLPVGDAKEIEGFSVTMEPRGGSPQPTGEVQLRATVK